VYQDRIQVNGPPGCNCAWNRVRFLDLRNTGVEVVFKNENDGSPLILWSPFSIKKKIAAVVFDHDLPVSIRSYTKAQIRDFYGQPIASLDDGLAVSVENSNSTEDLSSVS
jgi:hypothetical protein